MGPSRLHYSFKCQFKQPDYHNWASVTQGMTKSAVLTILGTPDHDKSLGRPFKHSDAYFVYGYLQMPLIPNPRTYSFVVVFDVNDRVCLKTDPFNGRFSSDGRPMAPELIAPISGSLFAHYPRVVDMRWYPSSGVYPLFYTIEIGTGSPHGDDPFRDEVYASDLDCPFYMAEFRGAQPGRFRVKARNAHGDSEWSDYRYFAFAR
jgi:hypothetical protein